MKRARVEEAVAAASGSNNDAQPKAKKARRARITRKFKIIPLDQEQNRMFFLGAPVQTCMDRLHAANVLAQLRAGETVSKPEIPITTELRMLVHNVVLTTELFEDPELSEGARARKLLEEALAADATYDDGRNEEREPELSDDDSDDAFRMLDDFTSASNPIPSAAKAAFGTAHSTFEAKPSVTPEGNRYYEVPLRKLNYYLRHYGPQFNSKRFTAVIIRNDELSAASLIFGSVKIVCTGCARIELALYLMQNTLDKIRATGYDGFLDPTPCLRNIVSGGRFPRPICTNLMTVLFNDCCHRVEQFPGTMVCHKDTGKRVTLIFESGEICHSGAQTLEQIHHDIALIYPMILRCIKSRKNSKDDAECERILSMGDQESTGAINAANAFLVSRGEAPRAPAVPVEPVTFDMTLEIGANDDLDIQLVDV